jgi:hypothetical protein
MTGRQLPLPMIAASERQVQQPHEQRLVPDHAAYMARIGESLPPSELEADPESRRLSIADSPRTA